MMVDAFEELILILGDLFKAGPSVLTSRLDVEV